MNFKSVLHTSGNSFIVTDIGKAHIFAIPFQRAMQSLQTYSKYPHYYHFIHRSCFREVRFRHDTIGFIFFTCTYPVHFMTATHCIRHTATHLRCIGFTTGKQPRPNSIASANQGIFGSVENSHTGTRHQLFSGREPFRTVGQQTTVIPMNFHFRHCHSRHILTSRKNHFHVLGLRSTSVQQQR